MNSLIPKKNDIKTNNDKRLIPKINKYLKKTISLNSFFLCANLVKNPIEEVNVKNGINSLKKLFINSKLPYLSGPSALVTRIVVTILTIKAKRFENNL